jgi:maltose/moltooligosaccharide transporter
MHQKKPELTFWQIWNMCFGYLGIQFGFSLQNSNISRIFETLGADYSNIAILFVAAPLTGLIVQPIIGYLSDKTWNRFGRRGPYFLSGAIAASLALFIMPNSPYLWVAAGMLWILDASINVCMEPTRAFVGDMLPKKQRTTGFAMQTFFIGIASVVASALPWMMTNWFSISNTATLGLIPDSVKFSFYFGAIVMIIAVLLTYFTTKEYSPEQLKDFSKADQVNSTDHEFATPLKQQVQFYRDGIFWCLLGVFLSILLLLNLEILDKGLFIVSFGVSAFGICQLFCAFLMSKQQDKGGFCIIMQDLFAMPNTMKQLALVQLFSWIPFFTMWAYLTAVITSHHFGSSNTTSVLYNQGANWAGILNAVYNATTILVAMLIPMLVRLTSLQTTHMVNLTLGGLSFISFIFIDDPIWLIVSMIGIGFSWASILSIPYILISNCIPYNKMGTYMGLSNLFIVIPQILAASTLGFVISNTFDNEPIYTFVLGGISMLIAALLTLNIKQKTI